jgi:hypothetical protein
MFYRAGIAILGLANKQLEMKVHRGPIDKTPRAWRAQQRHHFR